jgi:hypothetical protein
MKISVLHPHFVVVYYFESFQWSIHILDHIKLIIYGLENIWKYQVKYGVCLIV